MLEYWGSQSTRQLGSIHQGKMLRAAFISLSKARWARHIVTRWKIAWRVASRFIAGETLEDALRVVQHLNQGGIFATLDPLGENTTDSASAATAVQEIVKILDEISRRKLISSVSIKLTQLGLLIDRELAYRNLLLILAKANATDNFIRVDMEDSSLTQATLDLVVRARMEGFDNTGVVLQSYLYRTEMDANRMVELGIPVRLVKGAYKEPATLAYPRKKEVNGNFDRITEILVAGMKTLQTDSAFVYGKFPPFAAIGTHDDQRIHFAIAAAERAGLPKSAVEFQMLYGIRRDLQQDLVERGYPLRVYVPFGEQWYPYFMRRLAERPANLWFFFSNLFQH